MNEFSATNHYYSEDRERYERRVSKSLEDIAGELTQTNFLLQQILDYQSRTPWYEKAENEKMLKAWLIGWFVVYFLKWIFT